MNNRNRKITWIAILLAAPIGATVQDQARAQTPAPATFTQFAIPLTDKTIANAIILPAADGRAYLVYSTATGKLAILWISATPQPPDIVPPPPVPTKLKIAVIEDPLKTTPAQRQLLTNPAWRTPAATNHNLIGIVPQDLIQPETGKPPASLRPFLDATRGKPLPRLVLADQNDTILYNELLPGTAQAINDAIKRYGG